MTCTQFGLNVVPDLNGPFWVTCFAFQAPISFTITICPALLSAFCTWWTSHFHTIRLVLFVWAMTGRMLTHLGSHWIAISTSRAVRRAIRPLSTRLTSVIQERKHLRTLIIYTGWQLPVRCFYHEPYITRSRQTKLTDRTDTRPTTVLAIQLARNAVTPKHMNPITINTERTIVTRTIRGLPARTTSA
jgi:hypothetical protein